MIQSSYVQKNLVIREETNISTFNMVFYACVTLPLKDLQHPSQNTSLNIVCCSCLFATGIFAPTMPHINQFRQVSTSFNTTVQRGFNNLFFLFSKVLRTLNIYRDLTLKRDLVTKVVVVILLTKSSPPLTTGRITTRSPS